RWVSFGFWGSPRWDAVAWWGGTVKWPPAARLPTWKKREKLAAATAIGAITRSPPSESPRRRRSVLRSPAKRPDVRRVCKLDHALSQDGTACARAPLTPVYSHAETKACQSF